MRLKNDKHRIGGWSCLFWLILTLPASGGSPGWRGDGTGQYPRSTPPTTWDAVCGKNILWRTKVGKSQSTPVVVGDRVFVTAEPDLLLCLERATGKILWRNENGLAALPPGTKVRAREPTTSPNCGFSSATPVCDGQYVYTCYGTGIVACHDVHGKRRWIDYLDLPQLTQYGRSVSPVLAGGKLLVSLSWLVALDPQTGNVLWQSPQAKPAYGTPCVTRIGTVEVAITPQGDCVRVVDGKKLARSLARMDYASPVVDTGVVIFGDSPTVALKLPEKPAESLRPEKLWESDDTEGKFFASPLCHDGLVYCASNEGILYVLETKTGKLVYRKELDIRSASGRTEREPASVYPSLTLVGQHLLLGNDAGEMLVLALGREYREVAHNRLDAGSGASPVADGALLFLRGGPTLYCISTR